MTLKEVLAQEKENLLCSLRECVRIRSVREEAEEGAPYGRGVRACLDYTLSLAKSLGLHCGELGHQVGWCEYGEGNEMVAVLGHLDVVPEGDGWTVDPYEGVIRDGKIYGRGTMDDKGPTIASIYALSAIQRLGLPVRRRIRVLFGTNEETGSADMKYYRANGGEIPVAGFTPDGEYPLVNGEKALSMSALNETVSSAERCGSEKFRAEPHRMWFRTRPLRSSPAMLRQRKRFLR